MTVANVTSVFDNIKEQIPGGIEKVKTWFMELSEYVLGLANNNSQIGFILMAVSVLLALLFGFRVFKRLGNGFTFNALFYVILCGFMSYFAFNMYTMLYS